MMIAESTPWVPPLWRWSMAFLFSGQTDEHSPRFLHLREPYFALPS